MQKEYPKAVEILPAVSAVGQDADDCYKLMEANDTQFTRRNWIRAYFAWIEAMCFALRRFVLEKKFQNRAIKVADIPEFVALSEVKYTVNPKGEAVVESANTRTLDYIGFSLLACSRLFKLGLSLNRGTKAGENLVKALKIRDRITHPKTVADITISDEDIKILEEFRGWFSGHLALLFNEKVKKTIRREIGIAKRTKKIRTLTFDETHLFKTK